MLIALTSPLNGNILKLHEFLENCNVSVDWTICTGMGIWPDPNNVDKATRKNSQQGDFAKLYINGWSSKFNILTISGVHEDHQWLQKRFEVGNTEILNNIHWLANGYKTNIGDFDNNIRITGFGKAFSESSFDKNLKGTRHYNRREVEKACSSGPTELLVLHEHPSKQGIKNIIYATRPKLICYVKRPSHDNFTNSNIQGIPCISLNPDEIKLVSYENRKFHYID